MPKIKSRTALTCAVVTFGSGFIVALILLLSSAGCSTRPPLTEPLSIRNTKKDSSVERTLEADSSNATQMSPAAVPPPKPSISCLRINDIRIIEVVEANGGCWLMYTSEDIKKRVAWSKRGNVHCETVRENIRQNLEAKGFKCRWRDQ